MSASTTTLHTCNCCEGVHALTPGSVYNAPGLPSLAYRTGTHGTFKQTMLASLAGVPRLTARRNDDPAIALLDACAVMLDVLTFYQERIANEGYLRTAVERLSVLELARTIGYELNPGVSAGVHLVFELETAPGAPGVAAIPVGTKVQSLPGQDEKPQTFETAVAIDGWAAWNRMTPQRSEQILPKFDDRHLYLRGTSTNLKAGDAILLIGDERALDTGNENWDFRILTAVETVTTLMPKESYTVVTLERGLGSITPHVEPASKHPRVFALRTRTNLFAYNAPDWRAMANEVRNRYLPDTGGPGTATEWPEFSLAHIAMETPPATGEIDTVYLDALYPKIVKDSWVVLSSPDYEEVFQVKEAADSARTRYGISAKCTRLTLLGENLRREFDFAVRETQLFGEAEELQLAARPVTTPVRGNKIILDRRVASLPTGRTLIVSGRRMRVRTTATAGDPTKAKIVAAAKKSLVPSSVLNSVPVTPGEPLHIVTGPESLKGGRTRWNVIDPRGFRGELILDADLLYLTSGDGALLVLLPQESSLIMLEPEVELANGHQQWVLQDANGFVGSADVAADTFESLPSEPADDVVSEVVLIKSVTPNSDPTEIVLEAALSNVYDRLSVTIYGNVARATHGESRQEVLGSGDGARPFQHFVLKQTPLTFTSAAVAAGSETTLRIRIDDILWAERPSLYQAGPRDRVYVTRCDDDGKVTVQFGDGVTGARLPTGVENVAATYRTGIGNEGMTQAGQLSLLMTRPLGVQKVHNPLAPAGAADPEAREDARRNAPFTVLTLDRIVSLRDFENFARAFAGIGKAQAAWLWDGERRLVHVTIAAEASNGIDHTIEATTDLYANLRKAMDEARDVVQPMVLASYTPRYFRLRGRLLIDDAFVVETVLDAVGDALRGAFAFTQRDFVQPVRASEVMAVMQRSAGVTAVFVDELYFKGEAPTRQHEVRAQGARRHGAQVAAAELLLLDPNGLFLTEVSA